MDCKREAAAHTPGPWSARRAQVGAAFVIYGPDNWTIAQTMGNSSPEMMERARNGVHEANAARIVHCVNSHDDMLAALRRAVLALAFAAESSPAMRDDYEAVSAAIEKATRGLASSPEAAQ